MDSAHLDPTVNVDRIESWVEREREVRREADRLPELATTGYLEPIMPGEAYSSGVAGADTWPEFLTKFTVLAETIPGPTADRLAALKRTRALVLRGAERVISCVTGPSRGNSDGRISSDRAAIVSRTRAMENGGASPPRTVWHTRAIITPSVTARLPGPMAILLRTRNPWPSPFVLIDADKLASTRLALTLLKDRRVDLYGDLSKSWEVLTVPG